MISKEYICNIYIEREYLLLIPLSLSVGSVAGLLSFVSVFDKFSTGSIVSVGFITFVNVLIVDT